MGGIKEGHAELGVDITRSLITAWQTTAQCVPFGTSPPTEMMLVVAPAGKEIIGDSGNQHVKNIAIRSIVGSTKLDHPGNFGTISPNLSSLRPKRKGCVAH
jgi:hypothetical protein